jgi:hypothetical protein
LIRGRILDEELWRGCLDNLGCKCDYFLDVVDALSMFCLTHGSLQLSFTLDATLSL